MNVEDSSMYLLSREFRFIASNSVQLVINMDFCILFFPLPEQYPISHDSPTCHVWATTQQLLSYHHHQIPLVRSGVLSKCEKQTAQTGSAWGNLDFLQIVPPKKILFWNWKEGMEVEMSTGWNAGVCARGCLSDSICIFLTAESLGVCWGTGDAAEFCKRDADSICWFLLWKGPGQNFCFPTPETLWSPPARATVVQRKSPPLLSAAQVRVRGAVLPS